MKNSDLRIEQLREFDKINIAKSGSLSRLSETIHKAETADNAYLFISLGGLGMGTLAKLKSQIERTFVIPEGKDRPDNVDFLAIDSDVEGIKDYLTGRVNESLKINDIFNLFDPSMIAEFSAKKFPQEVKAWMDPELRDKYMPTGAGCGGFRQVGRYMLFNGYYDLKQVIDRKIRNLKAATSTMVNPKFIVYLICGLGGGTGSGMIVDAAYLVRSIVERYVIYTYKLVGCLMTADVQFGEITDSATREYLKKNCYCALKEIDSFIESANYSMNYGSQIVTSTERIFDNCILLTGRDETGSLIGAKSKDKVQSILNNFLIELSTKSDLTNKDNSGNMTIDAFLDNSSVAIPIVVNNLSYPKNAHFKYCSLGSGVITLPIEQIYNYITSETMNRLSSIWNSSVPDNSIIENLIAKMKINGTDLSEEFQTLTDTGKRFAINPRAFSNNRRINDVINGEIKQAMQAEYNRQAWNFEDNFKTVKESLKSYVGKILNDEIDKMIKNNGFYYTYKVIESRVGEGDPFNGLLEQINSVSISLLNDLINNARKQKKCLLNKTLGIERDLKSVQGNFLKRFTVGGKIKEYTELMAEVLHYDESLMIYSYCEEIQKEILESVLTKLSDISRYIECFERMKEIIDENMRNPDLGDSTDYFSLTDTEDIIAQKIKAFIDHDITAKSNNLPFEFANHVMGEQKYWLSGLNDEFSPMKSLVHFIDREYEHVFNKTLDDYIRIGFGDSNVNNAVYNLLQQLQQGSKIIFEPRIPYRLKRDAMTFNYITVPQTASSLIKGISNFISLNEQLQLSVNNNRISLIHCCEGIPLYAYSEIHDLENEYENSVRSGDIVGMHISSSKTDNWVNAPNLDSLDSCERESEIIKNIKSNIEFAIKNGLLYCDEFGTYVCKLIYSNSLKDKQIDKLKNVVNFSELMDGYGYELEDVWILSKTVGLKNTAENLPYIIRMDMDLMKRFNETVNEGRLLEEKIMKRT